MIRANKQPQRGEMVQASDGARFIQWVGSSPNPDGRLITVRQRGGTWQTDLLIYEPKFTDRFAWDTSLGLCGGWKEKSEVKKGS